MVLPERSSKVGAGVSVLNPAGKKAEVFTDTGGRVKY